MQKQLLKNQSGGFLMKIKTLFIIGLILMFVIPIQAKKKKVKIPKEGIELSLRPSVGKTFKFKIKIQMLNEYTHKGATQSKLVQGNVQAIIKVLDIIPDTFEYDEEIETEVKDTATRTEEEAVVEKDSENVSFDSLYVMEYTFDNVAITVFTNQQISESDDVEELKDIVFKVFVNKEGGIIEIEGLDLEEEQEKSDISPMNFVLSPHLPDTNLTENFSWSSVTETTYTDQGLDINTKTNQEYNVVGFKKVDDNLIAEIKVGGNFEFVQKGQTEQDDNMYDVDIHAEGDISGKIVFDVDNGFLVEYKTDKSRNIKGEEINLSTNEKRPIFYFYQETFNAKLLEVVE